MAKSALSGKTRINLHIYARDDGKIVYYTHHIGWFRKAATAAIVDGLDAISHDAN